MTKGSTNLGGPAFEVRGGDREIIVRRTFAAPRELVFDAFTNLEHIGRWWGPEGFRTTTEHMDVRPGGVWRHVMHGPDGTDYPNVVVYREVERPARLSWVHGSRENDPDAFETTVTFEEIDGGTQVTLHQVHASKERRDMLIDQFGALEGGLNTLDRFAQVVDELQQAGV
jgi:uncharacterized protein YndB with AHSA1/START domain